MGAIGIVAEYDPFHRGHAWHIAESRRLLGEDAPVVCTLSGHWTQRGQAALTDKWSRCALALAGGADLVLELPLWWATSSAEGFARGAVEVLGATGVVDTLSFGSECGRLAPLARLAAQLDSAAYQRELTLALGEGISFAAARQRAVHTLAEQGEEDLSPLLEGANDNLAVEYLRALNALGSPIRPMAVHRRGAVHDSGAPEEGFASASYIRAKARSGEWEEVERWSLPGTAQALKRAGIAGMDSIERALLARLRTMGEGDFAALPDSGAGEGLPARLVSAAREAVSLENFYELAKTKRFAHARLRRLAVRAFLGLREQDRPAHPACLRVLGFNSRGQALLREMKGRAALPVVIKPAQARALGGAALEQLELEGRATDLYALCFRQVRPAGLDWTTSPVVAPERL